MTFQTINPATGEAGPEFPFLTDSEVFAALETADRCFHDDWRKRSVAARARIVGRAAEILREKRDEYQGYLTLEMGKVTRFGYMEVDLAADILAYYAKNAEHFLAPKRLPDAPAPLSSPSRPASYSRLSPGISRIINSLVWPAPSLLPAMLC
ncbi:aldehyde dehydrogenase family protein [Bradyrhizobium diversitatis]|uniref:aldehyde dehydrogenase family protein n=1 Tax=Bradyrhizobium diversitatis TaxID=2755406 RepID=UPI0024C05093|nr:aldehyde dehydrogenase family protein [Bradyrhizobium diversitatis]